MAVTILKQEQEQKRKAVKAEKLGQIQIPVGTAPARGCS